ncbi:MAG: phosphoglycerate kinase [Phycisphaerales bacterium]|nr:phosphoglycerate kinase [Phycisphaerales bacterium]
MPSAARTTIDAVEVSGKTVLVRVDFNVPMSEGEITDDSRIRAAVPTIQSILDRGGSCVLMSHLGRPSGNGFEAAFTLAPAAARLAEILGRQVDLPSGDCVDEVSIAAVGSIDPGGVILLENLRFHGAEKKGDADFAARLASYGELYCQDAFGAAHRADASMVAVPEAMAGRPRTAGRLLEAELKYLSGAIDSPERPFVAVLGGAKISDKLATIRHLAGRVDTLVVGGAMAFTLLRAMGHGTGRSLVEESMIDEARAIIEAVEATSTTLLLPADFVCAGSPAAGVETSISGRNIEPGLMGLDIGPASISAFVAAIREARTVVWNGPMGLFEISPFDAGTLAVAKAMIDATTAGATSVIGGGDTAAAVNGLGLASGFTHVSTGGGASLRMLEGGPMPGVEALDRA